MSPPSPTNPVARWLASWRFAWRTALLDLRRNTGATALSLLLVIVPIAVTVMGATAISSTNSARALHLVNPDYRVLLTAEVPATKPTTTINDLRNIAAVTGEDLSAGFTTTQASEPGGETQFTVLHLESKPPPGVPIQLLSGSWPTTAQEVLVVPGGRFGHLSPGDTFTANNRAQTVEYTVVGQATGAIWTGEQRLKNIEAITHAPANRPPPEATWHWLVTKNARAAHDESLVEYHVLGFTKSATHIDWSLIYMITYGGATSAFDFKVSVLSTMEPETVISTFPLWVLLVIAVGLVVSPALLLAIRRHRRTLTIAHGQGASAKHLRRVMSAQAVLMSCVSLLAVSVVCGILLPLVEWFLRSPSRGVYSYATTINITALAIIAFSVLIGCLVSGRLIASPAPSNVMPSALRRVASRKMATMAGTAIVIVSLGLAVVYPPSASFYLSRVDYKLAVWLLIGFLLLTPALLRGMAFLAERGPVWLRLGMRDAARVPHRSVPLVGAVMAATLVAILVSWNLGGGATLDTSDSAQSSDTYELSSIDYPASASEGDIAADVAILRNTPAIDSAFRFSVARALPLNTFVPPSENARTFPSSLKNVLMAAHESCRVQPDDGATSDTPVAGELVCAGGTAHHHQTFEANDKNLARAVVVMTTDDADKLFDLSDEERRAYVDGSAIDTLTRSQSGTGPIHLMAWKDLPINNTSWQAVQPVSATLPRIQRGESHGSGVFLSPAVIVSPTVVDKLGVTPVRHSVLVKHATIMTPTAAAALDASLTGDARRVVAAASQASQSRHPLEKVGLWFGGVLLLVVVVFLTALNALMLRSETHIIHAVGSTRSILRAVISSQSAVLTVLGMVLGGVIGAAFLLLIVTSFEPLHSGFGWDFFARTSIGNADWATLASVMLAVAAVAPIVASLCLPHQDRGIRRVH